MTNSFTSASGAVHYVYGPAYGAHKASMDKMAADMAIDLAEQIGDAKGGAGAKKRGLGRGLEALLGPTAAAQAPALEATPGDVLRTLPVDALQAGKYQPRKVWDEDKLAELAESIKAQGVIQPIVVREQLGADGKGGRIEGAADPRSDGSVEYA